MKQKSIRRTKKEWKNIFQIGNVVYCWEHDACATIIDVSSIHIGDKTSVINCNTMLCVGLHTGLLLPSGLLMSTKGLSIRLATQCEKKKYYQHIIRLFGNPQTEKL